MIYFCPYPPTRTIGIGSLYFGKMEALFKKFDIPYHAITGLLQIFDGCIAGSSVLHSYLSQTEELSWEPNDIDIWIPIPSLTKSKVRNGLDSKAYGVDYTLVNYDIKSMKHVIDNLFERYNFILSELNGRNNYMDYKACSKGIIYSISYYEKNGKMIQVIYTSDIPRKELLENFDMTICRISWDPQTQFTTPSPTVFEDIKNKRAVFAEKLVKLRSGKMEGFSEKQMKRINKYLDRGFQICLPVDK